MTKRLILALIVACFVAAISVVIDRYLFTKRISDTDLKIFYHVIQRLTEAKTDLQRTEAIRAVSSMPEMRGYRVALAADHLVLLHTKSLTTEAYLLAHQLGTSSRWSVGWLRGKRFSQIATFTPPNYQGP